VLAPGRPARPVQFIDRARFGRVDARTWSKQSGPAFIMRMARRSHFDGGKLLDTCKIVSGSDARFTWASEEFLAEQHVEAWSQMPLWVPESDPSNAGFFAFRQSQSRGRQTRLSTCARNRARHTRMGKPPGRPTTSGERASHAEREAELLESYRGDQGG